MDTMHPAVKYGLFLVALTAVVYGIFGLQEIPQRRVSVTLGAMVFLAGVGLIGRKLAKDPFVGFVSTASLVLVINIIGKYFL